MFVLTLAWRDWIEAVFPIDLDGHGGNQEWHLTAALTAGAVAFDLLALRERHRLAVAGGPR